MRSMLVSGSFRRRRFDVLNTHSGHDSLVAGTAGRLAGTPLIVRTRHLALPISSLATYTWLPHRVIAVSHYVRRYLISAGVAETRADDLRRHREAAARRPFDFARRTRSGHGRVRCRAWSRSCATRKATKI